VTEMLNTGSQITGREPNVALKFITNIKLSYPAHVIAILSSYSGAPGFISFVRRPAPEIVSIFSVPPGQ
jgi:hypothetical protein